MIQNPQDNPFKSPPKFNHFLFGYVQFPHSAGLYIGLKWMLSLDVLCASLNDAAAGSGGRLPSLCKMSYEAGSCGDTYVRYYYDARQRTCKQFNYTGCLGNDNNFLNFVDCMTVCGRFSPMTSGTSPLDDCTHYSQHLHQKAYQIIKHRHK